MLQYLHQIECTTRDQGNVEEPTLQREKGEGHTTDYSPPPNA
jgi:hypothetical protein